MAILAVDEIWLREPRLLVPRMQPLGQVVVDLASPMGQGVKHAFIGTSWADLATSGNPPIVDNGDDAYLGPIAEGMAMRLNTDVDAATLTTRPTIPSPWRPGASDFSVALLLIFRRETASADTMLVAVRSASGASNSSWMIAGNYQATSTDYKCGFLQSNGTTNYSVSDTAARSLNTPTLLVATKAGTTATLYRNGTYRNAGECGSTTNATTVPLTFGHGMANAGLSANVDILMFAMWSRALSAVEVADLWLDPYQMFSPA